MSARRARSARTLTVAAVVLALGLTGCSIIPIPGLPFTTPSASPVTSDSSTVRVDFVMDQSDLPGFLRSTLEFEQVADDALRTSDLGSLGDKAINEEHLYSLYFYGPDSTSMWELLEPLTEELDFPPTRAYLSDSDIQEPMLVTLD